MRLVCTSDTHGNQPWLPPGDVLIHAGDLTSHGSLDELKRAGDWLACQPHAHKLVIGGNHDRILLQAGEDVLKSRGLVYLLDSGMSMNGFSFWGSPRHPTFPGDWAFTGSPEFLAEHWKLVPEGTDVLITHGPPYGILDTLLPGSPKSPDGHAGCKSLLEAVRRIAPRLHIFGHVHEAHGQIREGQTLFSNVSFVARDINGPKRGNPATVIDLERNT